MSETKVVTGKVRFSYANVFTPKAIEEGAKEKYSVALLIPKEDKATVKKINAAIEAAKELGKAKFGGKIPATLKLPLRDGDEERPEDETYAGMYFINANSDSKPGIIDTGGKKIVEDPGSATEFDEYISNEEFYSGCWGKASVNFYAFNMKNKGIACGLNNLLKLEDGDRLAGTDSATNDFADDIDGLLG